MANFTKKKILKFSKNNFSDQSTDKYESKLKEASDGQYQYEALLIIKNWQETDAESKYFFKVVNADGEKR